MAVSKKVVTGPWRSATVEVAVTSGEGDGLNSLRALITKYGEKAEYLKTLLLNTKNTKLAKTIAYYQRAARAIEDLLPEFSFRGSVFTSDAVDQSEVIISDTAAI